MTIQVKAWFHQAKAINWTDDDRWLIQWGQMNITDFKSPAIRRYINSLFRLTKNKSSMLCITGNLWRETISNRWIPHTKETVIRKARQPYHMASSGHNVSTYPFHPSSVLWESWHDIDTSDMYTVWLIMIAQLFLCTPIKKCLHTQPDTHVIIWFNATFHLFRNPTTSSIFTPVLRELIDCGIFSVGVVQIGQIRNMRDCGQRASGGDWVDKYRVRLR